MSQRRVPPDSPGQGLGSLRVRPGPDFSCASTTASWAGSLCAGQSHLGHSDSLAGLEAATLAASPSCLGPLCPLVWVYFPTPKAIVLFTVRRGTLLSQPTPTSYRVDPLAQLRIPIPCVTPCSSVRLFRGSVTGSTLEEVCRQPETVSASQRYIIAVLSNAGIAQDHLGKLQWQCSHCSANSFPCFSLHGLCLFLMCLSHVACFRHFKCLSF